MRFLFLFVFYFCCVIVKAQNTQDLNYTVNIHAGGHIIAAYPASKIDSVTFSQVPQEVLENLSLFTDTTLTNIEVENIPNLNIHEGLVCQKEQTIRVMRAGEVVAIVKLGEPVIVAQAEKEYDWGYFQFPIIFRAENNNLIVYWQMQDDSHTAYGRDGYDYMMSRDEGKTWEYLDREYYRRERNRIDYANGDVMQENTPVSKNISNYDAFPERVNTETISGYDFYLESQLPEELKGAYLHYWNCQTMDTILDHAKLIDPGYLRYSIDGQMPIVWWGNIRLLQDGTVVSGIYPCFYQDVEGNILKSGISFYKSVDNGYTWEVTGKIPYQTGDNDSSCFFDGSESYSEPAFEILRDGSYLCVFRTGQFSPMLKTYSKDQGKNWTEPKAFTPNGVKPNIVQLDNGIIVLSSGRPGAQIRFNIEGDGEFWTEPIEMMPFLNENGSYYTQLSKRETCGYSSILKVDKHTIYLVYSDFRSKNSIGDVLKTIYFRKIEVIKR